MLDSSTNERSCLNGRPDAARCRPERMQEHLAVYCATQLSTYPYNRVYKRHDTFLYHGQHLHCVYKLTRRTQARIKGASAALKARISTISGQY